jgi:hypothetical protein
MSVRLCHFWRVSSLCKPSVSVPRPSLIPTFVVYWLHREHCNTWSSQAAKSSRRCAVTACVSSRRNGQTLLLCGRNCIRWAPQEIYRTSLPTFPECLRWIVLTSLRPSSATLCTMIYCELDAVSMLIRLFAFTCTGATILSLFRTISSHIQIALIASTF